MKLISCKTPVSENLSYLTMFLNNTLKDGKEEKR